MRYICTSIVATLALAGTSFAATIHVPGDHATIQGAINASSNGDVIAIAAGTYYEANLNPGGKAITIGSASGNLDVTIDAQQGGSVFVLDSGEGDGTVIKDLVITGGLADYGGGIYCFSGSDPTISNCTISGNEAYDYGGGIWCYYSNPTISGCTIEGNTSDYGGGGIFCEDSSPTISNCTIEGNTGDHGGGIFCEYWSHPTISGCTIEGNTAGDGGGICCWGGSKPTISGCTISGNTPVNFKMVEGSDLTILTSAPASPSGACCVSSGCHALTEDACAGMGGTWLGEGASCDDCAPTCQGDANADGTVDIFDLLKVIDGWGTCP